MDADPIKEVRKIRNWHIKANAVEILFGEYTIGPYAIGTHECTLNYSELAPWIKTDGPLAQIAGMISKPLQKEAPSTPPSEPTLPPLQTAAPIVPKPEPKKEATGTAFAINSGGDLLTNYHVVKGCSSIRVLESRIRRDVTVVITDEQNDLAVVRVKDAKLPPMHFRDGKSIRPADQVVALGFPYAGVLTTSLQITTGTVSALSAFETTHATFNSPRRCSPGIAEAHCLI